MRKDDPKPLPIGRPRSETATAHAAIMDAVYELLKVKAARDLTLDEIARRAKVSKPTLYKWWPSKQSLIMAMFHERIANQSEVLVTATAEESIRAKMRRLILEMNGLFGKVVADLIAEGQSDPALMKEFYERHGGLRRASTIADIEQGKRDGEFSADTDAQLLVDAIFGPVYFRLLLRFAPLTEEFGEELIDQVLDGVRPPRNVPARKSASKPVKPVPRSK